MSLKPGRPPRRIAPIALVALVQLPLALGEQPGEIRKFDRLPLERRCLPRTIVLAGLDALLNIGKLPCTRIEPSDGRLQLDGPVIEGRGPPHDVLVTCRNTLFQL